MFSFSNSVQIQKTKKKIIKKLYVELGGGKRQLYIKRSLALKLCIIFSFIRSRLYLQIVVFFNVLVVPRIFLIEFQSNASICETSNINVQFLQNI